MVLLRVERQRLVLQHPDRTGAEVALNLVAAGAVYDLAKAAIVMEELPILPLTVEENLYAVHDGVAFSAPPTA